MQTTCAANASARVAISGVMCGLSIVSGKATNVLNPKTTGNQFISKLTSFFDTRAERAQAIWYERISLCDDAECNCQVDWPAPEEEAEATSGFRTTNRWLVTSSLFRSSQF
jgi:hypothetical protein